MILRPYQNLLINEIRKKFTKSKRVILCAPTGAGKTVVFSKIVNDTLQKDLFNRVLIITDRIELLKQTWRALEIINVSPQVFNAKTKKDQRINGRCVVAMVETLKRRFDKDPELLINQIGNFNLIIIDEAHKGNFNKIFEIFPNAFVIGATATPISNNKKKPLNMFYQDIAFVVDVMDLVNSGYLVAAESYTMRDLIDENILRINYQTGDFTDKSLNEAFSSPKLYDGLMSAYKEHGVGKKTIIFCVNIEQSKRVAELLNAFCVHSKTPKQVRDEQLRLFHESKDGVMVNCGILTTGYDHPPIEVVMMNRATMSMPLWLQCCGRGARISENKKHFKIIDFGGNIDRLGLWEVEREWEDWFFRPPKPGSLKPAPTKNCPTCNCILHARVMECPFCGHIFKAKEVEKERGQLVQVTRVPDDLKDRYVSDLTEEELHQLKVVKGYKLSFITRILRSRGIESLKKYSKIAGYKPKWYIYQINGPKDFKNFKIKQNDNTL